ncbi:polyphosphate polymerase domain-containing protein [Clostridium sp. BNL1100]|uniref:polyphosphate polymerase domain-containing protein n=1 Tax=Clostridium sp. BNL1100 TaxID=755731 RepID=UPI00024A7ED0|nr:polyphosphate polymerase domain-containing protein [Clostridium sp. BNL1100]AEY64558.1 VTC domain-containing protein [Clostridium sp. BNL1100]
MEELKLRHEIKHEISTTDYIALQHRLKFIAQKDQNVDESGRYKIRSLYFDNVDDKALKEKIIGLNNREKFRIRYYNGDTRYIKLEKKGKINGLCYKKSTRLTMGQCEQIINGDIKWMGFSGDPLLLELYTKMNFQQLRPRTLVDYIREPYIYKPGNVRITFDSGIKTGLNSKELFNQQSAAMNVHNLNKIILEVKFDEFLPEIIRDIIQLGQRQNSAFSKYAACRIFG